MKSNIFDHDQVGWVCTFLLVTPILEYLKKLNILPSERLKVKYAFPDIIDLVFDRNLLRILLKMNINIHSIL